MNTSHSLIRSKLLSLVGWWRLRHTHTPRCSLTLSKDVSFLHTSTMETEQKQANDLISSYFYRSRRPWYRGSNPSFDCVWCWFVMGGAVSLQQRCRKALVIRAYNIRPADQTIEDQFSAYSFLKGDGQFYTNADLIKQCLNIGSNDYPWLEPLMQILSGASSDGSSSSGPKVS